MAKQSSIAKCKILGALKLIIFLTILLACIFSIHNILKRKGSYKKMDDFFAQEADFDVLFYGSSHMLNGVDPMQLWHDYGIISYNLGNAAEILPTTYHNIKLSLEYTKPKLVVIDTLMLFYSTKYNNDISTHDSLDAYPISLTKYEAIKDIFEGEDLLDREIEFLFNFSKYHSRWKSLTEKDFAYTKNYAKGFSGQALVATPNEKIDFSSTPAYDKNETTCMIYLKKILDYCKENNIEVLLVHIPYPPSEKGVSGTKYTQKVASEYNVNFLNFLDLSVENYDTDYADPNSHVNISGARKVTDYLGKYIQDTYQIPNQKSNDAYRSWYDDYDQYIDFKIKTLNSVSQDYKITLMLLSDDPDVKYEITLSSQRDLDDDPTLKNLLKNLGNPQKIENEVFKEHEDKTLRITTYDNRSGKKLNELWF